MEQQQIIVRKMARALARAGLVTAFGHCSVRLDERSFLVCPPNPWASSSRASPGRGGGGPAATQACSASQGHQQIWAPRDARSALLSPTSPRSAWPHAQGAPGRARITIRRCPSGPILALIERSGSGGWPKRWAKRPRRGQRQRCLGDRGETLSRRWRSRVFLEGPAPWAAGSTQARRQGA